jgi:hypothetical protein
VSVTGNTLYLRRMSAVKGKEAREQGVVNYGSSSYTIAGGASLRRWHQIRDLSCPGREPGVYL